MYVCVCVCLCVCVSMYMCVCVCMYVWMCAGVSIPCEVYITTSHVLSCSTTFVDATVIVFARVTRAWYPGRQALLREVAL